TGSKVSRIYLTGGTSNIRGIDQYIEEKIAVTTERFPELHSLKTKKKDNYTSEFTSKFVIAALMAVSYNQKSLIANALTDEYSQTGSNELPWNTMAFVGIRSFICAIIVSLSLFLENTFITTQKKEVMAKL